MRQHAINTDIVESLRANEPLEDDVFLQLEKIEALCNVRKAADAGEASMPSRTMTYFSMILEQEVKALRKLLDQIFS
jgi:hypothetical protein